MCRQHDSLPPFCGGSCCMWPSRLVPVKSLRTVVSIHRTHVTRKYFLVEVQPVESFVNMAMMWLYYAFSFTFLAIWRFFRADLPTRQRAGDIAQGQRGCDADFSLDVSLFFPSGFFFQPRHAMPPSAILPNCPALLASWTFE